METALKERVYRPGPYVSGHRPAAKAVHLDQRLLRATRKIAKRAVDHGLVKKEESLRPFWDGWEEEIKILRSKLNPLLEVIFEPPHLPSSSKQQDSSNKFSYHKPQVSNRQPFHL